MIHIALVRDYNWVRSIGVCHSNPALRVHCAIQIQGTYTTLLGIKSRFSLGVVRTFAFFYGEATMAAR